MQYVKQKKRSHLICSGEGEIIHYFNSVKTWLWIRRNLGCNPSSTFKDVFNLSDHSVSLSIKRGERYVERIILITLQGY